MVRPFTFGCSYLGSDFSGMSKSSLFRVEDGGAERGDGEGEEGEEGEGGEGEEEGEGVDEDGEVEEEEEVEEGEDDVSRD